MTDQEILKVDFYDLVGVGSIGMTNEQKIKYWKENVENTPNNLTQKQMNNEFLQQLKKEFTYVGDEKISGKTALKIIENTIEAFSIPKEIEDAQKYISRCESDFGFMGSPDYYEKKKIVQEFYDKRAEKFNK